MFIMKLLWRNQRHRNALISTSCASSLPNDIFYLVSRDTIGGLHAKPSLIFYSENTRQVRVILGKRDSYTKPLITEQILWIKNTITKLLSQALITGLVRRTGYEYELLNGSRLSSYFS